MVLESADWIVRWNNGYKIETAKKETCKKQKETEKDKMKRKSRTEKTVKELTLRDDELLQFTTAVEGPLGYENFRDYRLSVASIGGLIVEKMIPGGWRGLRWCNEMY